MMKSHEQTAYYIGTVSITVQKMDQVQAVVFKSVAVLQPNSGVV